MLSDTVARLRRPLAVVVALILAAAAGRFLYVVLTDPGKPWPGLIAAMLAALLAFGLLRGHVLALQLTALLCVVLALIFVLGTLSPYADNDYLLAGRQPPTVAQTLAWLVPVDLLLLATAIIIYPRRARAGASRSDA